MPRNVLKTGAGTLTLSNAGNSFTSNLSIVEGTLSVPSIAATGSQPLGAATSAITIGSAAAAALQYTGSAAATLARQITVGGPGGATIRNVGTGLLV